MGVAFYCEKCRRRHSRRGPCKELPGLDAALKGLAAARRTPTDADRPPVSTFPGPRPRVIAGQLAFGDDDVAA